MLKEDGITILNQDYKFPDDADRKSKIALWIRDLKEELIHGEIELTIIELDEDSLKKSPCTKNAIKCYTVMKISIDSKDECRQTSIMKDWWN